MFKIDICPLCSSVLTKKNLDKVDYYVCEKIILDYSFNNHYLVINDIDACQSIYISPFILDNFKDHSRIYKICNEEIIFLIKTAPIHVDTYSNLLQRIKNLLIFL